MNEWYYRYAHEHHQELIRMAQTERAIRYLYWHSPGWRDRLLFALGDLLVALGNRLKSGSSLDECAQEGV